MDELDAGSPAAHADAVKAQLPTWVRIVFRRLLRRLRDAVGLDDVVLEVGAGLRGREALVIAATDRRLLVVSTDRVDEWAYEALSGASREDERTLAISGPGHSTTVTQLPLGRAKALAQAINDAIGQRLNDSPSAAWIADLEGAVTREAPLSRREEHAVAEVTTLRLLPSEGEEGGWRLVDSARGEQATGTSFEDQELSNHLERQWESPVFLGFDWPMGEGARLEGSYWVYRGRFLRSDSSMDDEEAEEVIQKRYEGSPMVGKERLDAFRAAHLPPPWSQRQWMAWLDARGSSQVELRRGRESIPRQVRNRVWRRDSAQCSRCGSRERLEFDHIVPVSKGGSNTERNIELLCESCNRRKGASV